MHRQQLEWTSLQVYAFKSITSELRPSHSRKCEVMRCDAFVRPQACAAIDESSLPSPSPPTLQNQWTCPLRLVQLTTLFVHHLQNEVLSRVGGGREGPMTLSRSFPWTLVGPIGAKD